MLNSIILMGRMCADPELKSTPQGVPVCSFSIAVDRDYTSGTEKQTDFINIVTWRQAAEFVSRYFAKGRMIIVKGSMQSHKWQDKDGNSRLSWEVVADRVWYGDSKKNNEPDNEPAQEQAPPAAVTDDDLPF